VNSAFITVVLAVLQIGLVGLELFATAFILLKLGGAAVRGLAGLSRRGGSLRTAAWGIAVVAVAGLTYLWGPHIAGLAA
jgi:hypothetical protein